ncbi:MAG: rhodanese-like domain-containing protein [Verrucomicrobiota bacterium]|mgnify:CR=1 FL=1|nr:rhodanese-like domain-containing protein [Verrucomicrobiota bacterium]
MGTQVNISVKDLKAMMDSGQKLRLIDVREKDEFAVAKIEGAELIPLSEFEKRALTELDQDEPIVLQCHHGGRSMQALQWLAQKGYKNLNNLAGGIDQWSIDIDPKVPRY